MRHLGVTLLLFSCVWAAGTATAVVGLQWQGRTIHRVESAQIKGRDLKLLRDALGLHPGSVLDLEALSAGIRELGGSGKWMRVFVEGRIEQGNLVLDLRGARVRRVRELDFQGVPDAILDMARKRFRQERDQNADSESFGVLKQLLLEAYQDLGYYRAEVHFDTSIVNEEEADVTVRVEPNAPTLIRKMSVRGGPAEENSAMEEQFGMQPGDVFARDRVNAGVDRIHSYLKANQYPTSRVTDTLFTFVGGSAQVDIGLAVRMGERFQIRFSGNHVFGEVQLRGLLTEDVLSQTDPSLRIAQLIEAKYRAVGYPDVQVRVDKSLVDEGRLNILEMKISEGERALISALRFSNGEYLQGVDLPGLFYESAPGVLKRGLYWSDGIAETIRTMQSKLQSQGYLNSRIGEPRVTFSEDRRTVVLFFDADLGVQTRLNRVEFVGLHHFEGKELERLYAFKMGAPLRKELVGETANRILSHMADSGFPQARLVRPAEESIEVSRDQQSAVVRYEIEEGPRFTIGTIQVEGLRKTQRKVVMREVELEPGQLYNASLVRQSEENLSLLGLFSRAEINETVAGEGNRMDLKISVRETRPGLGEFGLGGLYEEPRLRIRPFLGIAYRNLSGLNQTASFRGDLGLPISGVSGNLEIPFVEYSSIFAYRLPYALDLPVTFASQLSFDRVEVRPAEQTLQTRARIEGRLEKRFNAKVTAIYRLIRLERTTTESLQPVDPVDGIPLTESIGSTGPGLIVDLRDDIFNPTRGSFHALDVELAHPFLLSQDNIAFLLGLVRNSFYIPVSESWNLAVSANLGYAHSLFGTAPLARARLVNELALGGQGSIRGIAPRRLSPPLDSQSMAFYNARAELTIGIYEDFGFAVFFDSGQIFPDFQALPRSDGVGVGLRYRTPVGPVVIDFAQGLGGLGEAVKFYFTVGTI